MAPRTALLVPTPGGCYRPTMAKFVPTNALVLTFQLPELCHFDQDNEGHPHRTRSRSTLRTRSRTFVCGRHFQTFVCGHDFVSHVAVTHSYSYDRFSPDRPPATDRLWAVRNGPVLRSWNDADMLIRALGCRRLRTLCGHFHLNLLSVNCEDRSPWISILRKHNDKLLVGRI